MERNGLGLNKQTVHTGTTDSHIYGTQKHDASVNRRDKERRRRLRRRGNGKVAENTEHRVSDTPYASAKSKQAGKGGLNAVNGTIIAKVKEEVPTSGSRKNAMPAKLNINERSSENDGAVKNLISQIDAAKTHLGSTSTPKQGRPLTLNGKKVIFGRRELYDPVFQAPVPSTENGLEQSATLSQLVPTDNKQFCPNINGTTANESADSSPVGSFFNEEDYSPRGPFVASRGAVSTLLREIRAAEGHAPSPQLIAQRVTSMTPKEGAQLLPNSTGASLKPAQQEHKTPVHGQNTGPTSLTEMFQDSFFQSKTQDQSRPISRSESPANLEDQRQSKESIRTLDSDYQPEHPYHTYDDVGREMQLDLEDWYSIGSDDFSAIEGDDDSGSNKHKADGAEAEPPWLMRFLRDFWHVAVPGV